MSQEIRLHANIDGLEPEPKFKDWEIEEAVGTILKAEEIKQNKELMALVAPKLQKAADAAVNAANVLYGEDKKQGEENNDN